MQYRQLTMQSRPRCRLPCDWDIQDKNNFTDTQYALVS